MRVFNFRHLLNELGIPLSNKADWQAGQVLRKLAQDHGIQPLRLMADKTDPDPTVAAQHVIAHYPIEFYPVAKAHFKANFEEERKQIGMFD